MSVLEDLIKKHCPSGVEYKYLGELLQPKGYIRGPFGSALKKEFFLKDGVPVYEQQHAIYNKRNFRYFIDYEKAEKLKRFTVKPYDIIISCSGTIGKISIIMPEDRIGIINQALLILRLDLSKVNVKYIKYYFECFTNLIVTSSGGAITNIEKREIIEKIKIPVPPIEIQKEIVRILDTFTEYQDCLNEELTLRKKQYEYYRDKLLTFNNDVEWKCLVELLQPKGYIRGPFGSALKKDFFVKEGVPVYEQQHAIYNKRNFRYFIDYEKAEKLKRFTVKPYDIIISCSGTIGKISIIMPEDRIGIINQALLILRLDLSQVSVKYIKYYFECFTNLIVTSSGGAITNIEKREIIEKIKIPVPPLEEQERIVKILDRFDALCNDISLGLPAEIEMRKKQYEYYRDKLLTFKEKKIKE